MVAKNIALMTGSRFLAAAFNLAAVIVFTRLLGPQCYGEYLLYFALAYVVYGFSLQWLSFAYFARYRPDLGGKHTSTMLLLAILLLVVVAALSALVAGSGLAYRAQVLAVFMLVAGFAIYDAFIQIGRTNVLMEKVALVVLARAVGVLAIGASAITWRPQAEVLALAVAAAHVLAVLPIIREASIVRLSLWSKEIAAEQRAFGGPLMLSFGVAATGQHADRLVLAHLAGSAALGAYGAAADLIRQGMTTIGEAISYAYVTVAKAAHARNDTQDARRHMADAECGCLAVAAFGFVFVTLFGAPVLGLLLGAPFRALSEPVLPLAAAAAGVGLLRSYYLGQIIYFEPTSRLELEAASATALVSIAVSLAAIPVAGLMGAATAALAGQLAAAYVLLRAARRSPVYPLDAAKAGHILAMAGGALLLGWGLIALLPSSRLGSALAVLLFLASLGFTVWRYDVLAFRRLARAGLNRIGVPLALEPANAAPEFLRNEIEARAVPPVVEPGATAAPVDPRFAVERCAGEVSLSALLTSGETPVPVALPFQTPAWIDTWFMTVGKRGGYEPVIMRVHEPSSGETALVLPLASRRQGPLRQITFADSWINDCNQPLLGPAAHRLLGQEVRGLKDALLSGLPPADVILLERMPERIEGLPNPLFALGTPRPSGFSRHLVDARDGFAGVLTRMSKSRRGMILGQRRKLEGLGHLQFHSPVGPRERRAMLDVLDDYQLKRLAAMGTRTALTSPAHRAFYRAALDLPDSPLTLDVMTLDDQVIGVVMMARHGDTVVLLRQGYEQGERLRFGLGNVLLLAAIERSIGRGAKVIDLSIGDAPWKLWYNPQLEPLFDVECTIGRRGAGLMRGLRFARRAARGSKDAIKRLRRLRAASGNAEAKDN